MNNLRHAFSPRNSLLAAALALCLAPRPVTAQIGPVGPGNNYYPSADAPVNGNDALEFIESLLHEQYRKIKDTSTISPIPGATTYDVYVPSLYIPDSQTLPSLPPLPGDDNKIDFSPAAEHYILASDIELDLALGSAVQKLLDGTVPPAYSAVTLSDLVKSVASYRKKTIESFVKTATINILNWTGAFPGGSQTAALEALAAAACEADPAAAAGVVGTMLPLVVPKVKGSTPSLPVLLGTPQLTRTPSTTLTAANVATALNALPGVLSKGGVTTANEPGGVRVYFGSTNALIPTGASALALQNALNLTGLFNYGQFTAAIDSANTVAAFQDDFVIAFKPVNLNLAGAANWNATPGFDGAADEILRKAMEKASENAVAIVEAAIGVVMQGVDISLASSPATNGTLATAKQHAKDVAAVGINSAYTYLNGYLADEVAAAVGAKIIATSFTHKPSSLLKQPIALSYEIAAAVFSDVSAPTDLKERALIAAGLMKGFKASKFEGGSDPAYLVVDPDKPEENIVEQMNTTLSLSPSDKTYLDNVQFGFVSAYSATLPTKGDSVGQSVLAGMAGAPNEIAARITGAAAWLPAVLVAKSSVFVTFAKGSFIADVLQLDADLSSNDTVSEIVENAVRGSATTAATIANLAAVWAKTATSTGTLETQRYGKITEGAALGLKGQPLYNAMLNTVVGKVMAAAPLTKVTTVITNKDNNPMEPLLKTKITLTEYNADGRTQMKEITSYAISGALTAGHPTAAAGVAFNLAESASSFYQFYQPILEGAIDTAAVAGGGVLPDSEQWRAVLGVMAVKKLSTTLEFDGTYGVDVGTGKPIGNFQTLNALIPSFATNVTDYDNSGDNDDAITKGGNVIKNIQDYPKAVFAKAFDAFSDPTVGANQTLSKAVLVGVGLANSKEAPLAAALAVKFRAVDAALFQTEAIGLNPSLATNIKLAVSTASHVAAGTADLFDYLNVKIFQNSKYLTDIVTAATVVAPNYAGIIGHAAAFSSASTVAKAVPMLFNYAHITRTDPLVTAPLEAEYDNPVDAAAAVTAAITAGIIEAKTGYVTGGATATEPTIEITNLKNAITALVKQTLTLTGNSPVISQWLPGTHANLSTAAAGGDSIVGGGEGPNNFLQSDGNAPAVSGPVLTTSGSTLGKQIGPAAVITGFMSQVIAPADTRLPYPGYSSGDLGMVGQVIGAAILVVKSDVSKVLAIAQAAAQAARGVASGFSSTGPGQVFGTAPANGDGEKDVVLAILNAFIKKIGGIPFAITSPSHPESVLNPLLSNGSPNPYYQLDTKVANAVHFGVLAATNNVPAAGAAGVVNFAHHTLTGAPVTDIFGL